ncbi:MAG: hypothetical protein IKM08_08025 [Clostridia bacterium]|nr:hypothetical protein [Clostridia bacterium]
MIAGFAEREYTPAEGMVPGQIKVGYAKGKRTPLMAHVAVMESNGRGAVLVSLDILFVSVTFANKLRRRISEYTGYPTEQILVACSHTHTGCAIDMDCWAFEGKPEYLDPVEEKAMEAVKAAFESRSEVKMGVGTGFDARFNFCRDFYTTDGYLVMNPGHKNKDKLVKPFAAVDHSVNVMRFDDPTGKPLCFVVNYANHLDTGGGPKEDSFSADYAGYMRLALQREYGEDVTVLFLNGCCANVNHYDYKYGSDRIGHCREGAAASVEIGNGLAETIKSITPALVTEDGEHHIQGRSRMHMTAHRTATREQREWAAAYLESEADPTSSSNLRKMMLAKLYLTDPADLPATVDLEIQTLQIGPWTIVGLPGEIFSNIGLKIKANSPFANTIVVELANGTNGYMAPDAVQESGCYEGTYSNVAFTGHGTEKMLVDGATNMLNALFEIDNTVSFGGFRNKPLTL